MRHVVRKIEPQRSTAFDDRLWPVLSALLLLGAAVLGMIRASLRPDDPRPWLNAGVWTPVALAAIAVGTLAVLCIQPRWMRRRAQLSLILSLGINVLLLLALALMELTHAALKPKEIAEIQPAPQAKPVEPEYFPLTAAGPDRPPQEWTKPVPTGELEMQQQDWLNKSSLPGDTARPPVPDASAQANDPRPPLPRLRQQRIESVPREFDLQGAISRQERADTPRVAPPLMDASAMAQQTEPARLAAPPAELQRQVLAVAQRQLDLEMTPASQVPQVTEARPQHQQLVAPEPTFDAQPAVRQRMPTPGTPPQAEVALAERPAAARLTEPEAAAVARAVSPQRELAAPLPPTLEAPPGLDTTRLAAQPQRVRRQPAALAAQMAESNQPLTPSRQAIEATPATVTRLAPLPAAVRSAASTDATAAAASVAIARAEPLAQTPQLPSPTVATNVQPTGVNRPSSNAGPAAASAAGPAQEALPDPLPRAAGLTPAPPAAALARVGTDSGQAAGAADGTEDDGRSAADESGPAGPQAAMAQMSQASTAELLAATDSTDSSGTNVTGDSAVPKPGQPRLERSGPLETPPAAAPQSGGGTMGRLQPGSSALRLPAPTVAEALEVPGQESSAGRLEASPWADQGTRRSVFGTGIPGLQPRADIGAASDELLSDGTAGVRLAATAGATRARVTDNPQLAMGQQSESGSSATPDRTTRRPAGIVAPVPVPVPVAGTLAATTADPLVPEVSVAPQTGTVARNAAGALEIDVNAPLGLGGLGSTSAPDVGVIQRAAVPESELVADRGARFLRRNPGGPPSLDTRVAIPAEAFLSRFSRRGQEPVGGEGLASPKTEEAIERGLLYLARQQAADGHWSLAGNGEAASSSEQTQIRSDTAATGLALLSYLGAGYHHLGEKYRDEVRLALQFLVDHQRPDGDLYLPQDDVSNQSAWLYSHGIAAIALCEAYGMTQDPQLQEPAQRAVDFIVAAQHPVRGGWRYAPAAGSDTSVSGWMVMALRSAELAGLEVPATAWEGVGRWLDNAQASSSRPELYRYNPQAPETASQAHGRRPSDAMTAVGLLMRMYTGWRRENPNMIRGAEYLRQQLPEVGSASAPRRDTYYWYYATQVMFHMRGEYWDDWNQRLHPLLVSSQVLNGPHAGSWDPLLPVADRWGAQGGRLYVTTLNLLSLEVYYRHLPIYEDTAR